MYFFIFAETGVNTRSGRMEYEDGITSDDVVVGDFSRRAVERAAAAKFTIEQYYHNFFRSMKEREDRF